MNVTLSWEELSHYASHSERGSLLLEHADDLTNSDYWHAVADVWSGCDRQSLTRAEWRTLWLAPRRERWQVMTIEERDWLVALPERVTVYRGINRRNHMSGLSWTLDCDLAHWFGLRYDELKPAGETGREACYAEQFSAVESLLF